MPKMRNDSDLFLYALKVVQEAEANADRNPTSEEIQIVIIEPLKKPYKKMIPNTLGAMKRIVGGFIETHTFDSTEKGADVCIICNEEGKLLDLPFNRRIIDFDIISGDFFISAYNHEGDNISLTDEECEKYIKRFTPIEIYL